MKDELKKAIETLKKECADHKDCYECPFNNFDDQLKCSLLLNIPCYW